MYSTQCIWTAHTDTVQSWWSVHILHRRAFYLDSVLNCTMTLLWAISGWVPRHMIGAVLVSLPAVAVFSHITCDMHDSIQVNTRAKTLWRRFHLSFCVCVKEVDTFIQQIDQKWQPWWEKKNAALESKILKNLSNPKLLNDSAYKHFNAWKVYRTLLCKLSSKTL